MRVAIIGTGYVGLVSGACLADFGHEVVCVDSNSVKIEALKHGEIPIYEPGLLDLVRSNVKQERLSFASAPEEPVRAADVVFIAVGTPSRRGDGHADLSYAPSNEEKPLDTYDACNRWRCDCTFHAHTSVASGLFSLREPFSTGCISALGLSDLVNVTET